MTRTSTAGTGAAGEATAFRPVLLVPCYNHGDAIGATLAAVQSHDLPCLIVDDGSDAATARLLDALAGDDDRITLLRLPENRGKGAAVIAGIDYAADNGWTHALQLDADGQHDPGALAPMLERAEASPATLVSGRPVYADDVPRSRLYGRYLTHALVWLETLSFAIRDSMCGLRVYPIAACQDLFARGSLGQRMDFDTEIMVRLYWAGTPVAFVDTRVCYPPGGVSHFALVRDNLRMVAMHARLLFGMIPRAPRLLMRGLRDSRGQHWSRQSERGSYATMWLALQIYRLFGPRGIRLVLYPLVAYFFVTSAKARRASRTFLQRVYDCGGALERPPRLRDVFRHQFTFATSVVDRLEAWRGRLRHEHVQFNGRLMLRDEVAQGRGVMLLTSHLGNVEVTRGLTREVAELRLNALVYNHHAPRINRIIEKNNPNSRLRLVDIGDFGLQHAAWLRQQLEAGEFVAIAGDRTPASLNNQVVPVRFLGREAPFPTGPFIIASLLRCPVYRMTCVHDGDGYRVDITRFADRITLSRQHRQEDLQYWVQRYAEDLEQRALEKPMQWFNFYDFWAPVPPASGATATTTDGHDRGRHE